MLLYVINYCWYLTPLLPSIHIIMIIIFKAVVIIDILSFMTIRALNILVNKGKGKEKKKAKMHLVNKRRSWDINGNHFMEMEQTPCLWSGSQIQR